MTTYTTRTKPTTSWDDTRVSLWSPENLPWLATYFPWTDSDTEITTSYTERTKPSTSWT